MQTLQRIGLYVKAKGKSNTKEAKRVKLVDKDYIWLAG